MQTFLPYPDFRMSAQALDYRRLGKQRVECKQLLAALGREVGEDGSLYGRVPSESWFNHPATKMWRGYELALAEYQADMIREWISRGFQNTMSRVIIPDEVDLVYPPWLGDEKFHASHRSNLLRKDPDWYGRHGWKEHPNMEYVWPV